MLEASAMIEELPGGNNFSSYDKYLSFYISIRELAAEASYLANYACKN